MTRINKLIIFLFLLFEAHGAIIDTYKFFDFTKYSSGGLHFMIGVSPLYVPRSQNDFPFLRKTSKFSIVFFAYLWLELHEHLFVFWNLLIGDKFQRKHIWKLECLSRQLPASFIAAGVYFRSRILLRIQRQNRKSFQHFFCLFFGGLECVGHFFTYVAHLWFLRDVWIRTQSAAVATWRATDLATHPFSIFARDRKISRNRKTVSLVCPFEECASCRKIRN